MAFEIKYYTASNENEWDDFILNKAINGTFIQTRKFINYHNSDKFHDCSLCIYKGGIIVGAILACIVEENEQKCFFAHKGSTYGGITISSNIYNVGSIAELFTELLDFWKTECFNKVYLKMAPQIYSSQSTELLDYFFYKYGFTCYSELNFYMHLHKYNKDIATQFSKGKRRDYRYSTKNNLIFKKVDDIGEIKQFYEVLTLNLLKLDLKPVHTYEDLIDLKFNRFNQNIEFFGVFYQNDMIAGSMVFIFNNHIFHTQYLSSNENYLKLYPMDFLIYNLIETALERGMDLFSFGISTEDQGRYLNLGLARFKEGFGAEYSCTRSYELNI